MEETKERFELFGKNCIKDNNPDARCQLLDAYVACVILNEQDARIKELEEQAYPAYKREHEIWANLENIEVPRLRKENEQLQQAQKQLAISELEKLKDFFLEPYGDEKTGTEFLITTKNTGKIAEYVLDRIKSLKGE